MQRRRPQDLLSAARRSPVHPQVAGPVAAAIGHLKPVNALWQIQLLVVHRQAAVQQQNIVQQQRERALRPCAVDGKAVVPALWQHQRTVPFSSKGERTRRHGGPGEIHASHRQRLIESRVGSALTLCASGCDGHLDRLRRRQVLAADGEAVEQRALPLRIQLRRGFAHRVELAQQVDRLGIEHRQQINYIAGRQARIRQGPPQFKRLHAAVSQRRSCEELDAWVVNDAARHNKGGLGLWRSVRCLAEPIANIARHVDLDCRAGAAADGIQPHH